MNPKGGKFKTGVWIKRISGHENGPETGYLTYGKSYQVLSPVHYTANKNFYNKHSNLFKDVNPILAQDCVLIKDDHGKVGVFGVKNFKQTSK